jgi:hypothetical protein
MWDFMIEFLVLAINLAANPFALVGYIGLGVYATSTWRAFKYALLWGLMIQIFALALGKALFDDMQGLAIQTVLRLVGALIITMGVYYLHRAMSRKGGRGSSGPGTGNGSDNSGASRKKPPHLRRVK